MTDTIFFLLGVTVLLCVGVLIGSGLHTRSLDRQYRNVAQCVRHVNEREDVPARRGYPAEFCGKCPLVNNRVMFLVEPPPSVDENDED
jgi:hypothetical protein